MFTAIAIAFISSLSSAQAQPTSSSTLAAGYVPAVSINGILGSVQLVQYSTNLTDTNGWTTIGAVRMLSTNEVFPDTTATNLAPRFYRTQTIALPDRELTWIPPGTFVMGSPVTEQGRNADEGPQTTVSLTHGFFMGNVPVTDASWIAYMTNLPNSISNFDTTLTNEIYGRLPIRGVGWTDATNYCGVRTAAELAQGMIPPGWAFRLPTEAEWEYACRAGSTNPFAIGTGTNLYNDAKETDAWFQGSQPYPTTYVPTSPTNVVMATEPGRFATNAFGLYDMHGNVQEYCLDIYQDPSGPPIDGYPGGALTNPPPHYTTNNDLIIGNGTATVLLRGGSWNASATDCRSASRLLRTVVTGKTHFYIGFRVVLSPITYDTNGPVQIN